MTAGFPIHWLPGPDVTFGGSPGVSPYHSQHIPYTDFPLPEIKIVLGPAAGGPAADGPAADGPVVESVEEVEGVIASLPTES